MWNEVNGNVRTGEGGDEGGKWRCKRCDMSDGGEIGCWRVGNG